MFKNKTVLVILILVLMVGGLVFYRSMYKPAVTQMAPVQVQAANTVNIQNNMFSPEIVNIKVGDKVTWVNNDGYAHTVSEDDRLFDSGNFESGKMYSFTFTKSGTYTYHCAIHPSMLGKVIVSTR